MHSQPAIVSDVQKSKAEQTEIMSFLEKWLLCARIANADCTSAGQACWETEGCPLPSQTRAGSPASNPRVSLGSWVQPQDTGSITVEGGLSPPDCSYLTSRSGHSGPCPADFYRSSRMEVPPPLWSLSPCWTSLHYEDSFPNI